MRVHSKEVIAAIKNFRKNGHSIQEIVKNFKIPKTTVWHHVHGISLTQKQIKKIKERQGGSKIRYQLQLEKAKTEAEQIVSFVQISRCAPVLLSALYWAEGNKKSFVFTNTDERMIAVFLKILRSCFGVDDSAIHLTIRIAKRTDIKKSLLYWGKICDLPLKNIKININSRNNKSKSKYGICRVTVKKGGYLLKLVNGINKKLISEITSFIFKTA